MTLVPNNLIKPSTARNIVTKLGQSGVLLPVVLLETTVVGGRTLQAFKRGGKTEGRERLTEESIGAVFWLFGVKMLNKLGDKLAKPILGIDIKDFNVKQDFVRTPIDNIAKEAKGITKNKILAFKYAKILSSLAIGTAFVGFVVPRINQAITRKRYKEENTDKKSSQIAETFNNTSFDEFIKKISHKNVIKPVFENSSENAPKGNKVASFKGLDMAAIAHNIENHALIRQFSTDIGVEAGRASSARNKDERIEILTRDFASMYFYLGATNHIVQLLNKTDKFKGKNTAVDPTSAMNIDNYLNGVLNGKKMPVKQFKELVFGSVDKKQLEKLNFENGVIKLDDFITAFNKDKSLIKKATEMSGLQPKHAKLGSILTENQVTDVLSSGKITDPKFLKKILYDKFGRDSKTKLPNLINPHKFISQKEINSARAGIDEYVESIAQYAQQAAKKGGQAVEDAVVDSDILKKVNKRNLGKNGLFLAAGMAVSALFLSTIIPKFQYWITEKRTGTKEFPGAQEFKK